MSTETPETPYCKRMSRLAQPMTEGEPVQEMLSYEDAQTLERRNSELTARIAELEKKDREFPWEIVGKHKRLTEALAEARKDSARKLTLLDKPDCDGPWIRIERLRGGHLYPRLGVIDGEQVTYGDSVYYFVQRLDGVKWWRLPIEDISTEYATPLPETEGTI